MPTRSRLPRRLAATTATAALVTGALTALPQQAASAATPDLGPNVVVFDPSMSASAIQSRLDAVHAAQQDNEFGAQRHAFLFKPGSYAVDAKLGYYTSVAGLGSAPGDVVISGAVRVEGRSDPSAPSGDNALTNFWRSAENLSVTPAGGANRWAASQAAPLRRVHVRGDLLLHTAGYGYASGGFIADSKIDGKVDATTQQQYYTRDSQLGSWSGSVWNMVFSGVGGAPPQTFPDPQVTTLATTPVSREKPFLTVDAADRYSVFVPAARTGSTGVTWAAGTQAGTSIPISGFHIARPTDSAAAINAQLARGKHLLLTPGVYRLTQSLKVSRAGTVVLGLGMATLVPVAGTPAVEVADVGGVRLAGFLVDAGPVSSPHLLTIGARKTNVSHAADPASVHDVFFRVGGASAGRAVNSLLVNSNHVLLDHVWAWRADHGAGVGWTANTADSGVTVNGDHVTALGLFVEHYQKFQTVWNGQRGRTVFYQSELPYDPPSQSAWRDGGSDGYASYKVGASVTGHQAWGLGVYSFFNQNQPVFADRAVEVPDHSSVELHDLVSVFLAGSGGVNHVVNDTGAAVTGTGDTTYLVRYAGGVPVSRTAKKGVTAIKYGADHARLAATGATWFYDWSANGAKSDGMEYVPMVWNGAAATPAAVSELTAGREQGRYRHLLGFNEPDLADQAGMTVTEALDAWPALQSTGLTLGSPAPANYWSGWLDEFMTGARQRGYRVDFIALHIYPDWTNPGAIEEVRGTLADAWNKWRKPIWLTEIGTVDTSAWKPMYGTPTHARADNFLQKLVPLLESLPYVERYAWFADNCSHSATCRQSTLYADDDRLTSHGATFAAAGEIGPAGRFRLVSKAQPTVALHAAGEPYGGRGGRHVAVTPASWGWNEQRWYLSPAADGYYTVTSAGSPASRLTTTADPYPSGTGNRTVISAPAGGGDAQLWRLVRTADGYHRLISKAHGTALQSTFDPYNGRTDSYNVAGTSAAFVNDQQSWALVPG
ncbi:glycosyl hydrolase [Nonomuraea sp. SBT364]|uniref:glycosyl hydrolase n=1 Tax=Nonomuraea sp. SBT364 TaxID=1580530 RepID=UPI0007C71766|nr:glycosyl hydrolase [Nonomuraea sp. SBT364]